MNVMKASNKKYEEFLWYKKRIRKLSSVTINLVKLKVFVCFRRSSMGNKLFGVICIVFLRRSHHMCKLWWWCKATVLYGRARGVWSETPRGNNSRTTDNFSTKEVRFQLYELLHLNAVFLSCF